MGQNSPRTTPVLLALFLSGTAGLMHEVVWAKLLANLIGSTAHAHAVVLGVFMGGLALGAVLFGRRSDATGSRAVWLYAKLEIAIGLYCLALPWLTGLTGGAYEAMAAGVFENTGLKFVLRLTLALLVVLVPAVMMGGTLPILARHLIREVGETRRRVASLYALNNMGAVFGSGLAGFYLLPTFGIYGSLVGASLLNFAAAGMACLGLSDSAPAGSRAAGAGAPAADAGPTYTPLQFKLTLWALLLAGFAAMGYEVVLLRVIALGFGSSTYSFTVMLMCFITGIGLGSAVISMVNVKRPLALFAYSQVAVVVSLLLVTPLIDRLPYFIAKWRVATMDWTWGFESYLAGQAALCFLILLVPTMCIGVGFPLVSHIQARSVDRIGGTVGSTYAWNTVGNVLGVIVTSLVLLPDPVGMAGAFGVNVALSLLAIALLLVAAGDTHPGKRLIAGGAALVCVGLYVLAGPNWAHTLNHALNHLRLREGPAPTASARAKAEHPTNSYAAWREEFLVREEDWSRIVVHEDSDTTVLAARDGRNVVLYVNGKGDASTRPLDMATQLLIAHPPMMLMLDAKDVMVIGHGSGVTCGSTLLHPVERMDMVEISEGVLKADELFADFNHQVLSDERMHVYRDDARTFLRTSPRKYDLVLSQPSNPWVAGIGSLFTVDFYREAAASLKPGGSLCVWFHHYEQSNEGMDLVVRSLREVFPHVRMFLSARESDLIALASMEPLVPDFGRMEDRFEEPAIRRDLARMAIFNLATLFAYHGSTSERFFAAAGEGPVNTDLHQRIEYMGARTMYLGENADRYIEFEGFPEGRGAATGRLLDEYGAWRAAQGEPLTREELQMAMHSAGNVLGLDHRLVRAVRERVMDAPAAARPPTRPARGAVPPLESMSYQEAQNRGALVMYSGDRVGSIPLFRRALELGPTEGETVRHLMAMLWELDRREEAEQVLKDVLEREPKDSNTLLLLAFVYLQTDRQSQARNVYQSIIDREENPAALTPLADLTAQAGDLETARGLYERALARDPSYWQASAALAQILFLDPATQREAIDVVRKGLRHSPDRAELRALLARMEPREAAPQAPAPAQ